ncbi:MAG: glycosyl hydrolase family 28 protein [Fimbriimonas sp.]
MSLVRTYAFHPDVRRAVDWSVSVGDHQVDVLATDSNSFVTFEVGGPVSVVVRSTRLVESARITPSRHGIEPVIQGDEIRFTIPGPIHLVIEVPGQRDLYLWANGPENPPDGPDVVRFEEGSLVDVGELRLQRGQTLYLAGGAFVTGWIRATAADGLRISGPGVLSGASAKLEEGWRRAIVIEGSRDVAVEDIVMIDPKGWMLVFGDCEDVLVRGIKQIGTVISSDGIDIVGSRRAQVRDCFLRNGDDCVAIKSLDLRPEAGVTMDFSREVSDIDVTGCVLFSYIGGNALEIGHELRTDHVRNIRFADCDILGVHQFGAAFSIHNADRATVENVLFENIRVEHHYDKLVDLRVVWSRWSRDRERGHIRNVTFRNIEVTELPYNAGYTTSLIGGMDAAHQVTGVHFENVTLGGRRAKNADDLWLYTKHAADVTFA